MVLAQVLVVGPAPAAASGLAREPLVLGAAVVLTAPTLSAVLVLASSRPAPPAGAAGCSAARLPLVAGRWAGARPAVPPGIRPAVLDAARPRPPTAGCSAWPRSATRAPEWPRPPHHRPAQPGRSAAAAPRPGRGGWSTSGRRRCGARPARRRVALLCCLALTAVHRWVAARDEAQVGGRLRRSEAYFRSLVRSSSDAVLILDGGLRITWAAPALHPPRPTPHRARRPPLLEAVHPEDAEALAALWPRRHRPPSRHRDARRAAHFPAAGRRRDLARPRGQRHRPAGRRRRAPSCCTAAT